MQLFAGSSEEFIEEGVQKNIAEKLGDAFYEYYRFRASASEFNAWKNSLNALAYQLRYSGVRGRGVILEMQLPLSSARLDAFVFGRSPEGKDAAILMELKQWSEVAPSDIDECVEAFVGGAVRRVLHPCVQARGYSQYLQDSNSSFHREQFGIEISPCAWLHNMHPGAASALQTKEFQKLLDEVPLFLNNHADQLKSYFTAKISTGDGVEVMNRALLGKHAPSRKLLEHTAAMVKGEPRYQLIDDQVIAFNAVLAMVRRAQKDKREKAVVAVHGGPGTGKSVIALNLLGVLSKAGVNVHHATGSKAFTTNLWRILGSKSKAQVRYFNNFGEVEANGIDVILADEAHRVRESSNTFRTPKAKRTDRLQIDEMIDAAKVTVFFLDDFQAVRPGEIGSMKMIRETAMRHDARFESIDLRTQFRCGGSAEYIDWIDQLLEIRKTGVNTLEGDFAFSIVDSPEALESDLAKRIQDGATARIMAGFCWPWSMPTEDGNLIADVKIGDFTRPWNAKPDSTRLAKGIPPSNFWASDPAGFAQIGCIYTAQGFEFDYAGVIWGLDLVIRDGKWVGQSSFSCDGPVKKGGARFVDNVKNAYRVLLTRGMTGCSVYIQDEETREYISSRDRKK